MSKMGETETEITLSTTRKIGTYRNRVDNTHTSVSRWLTKGDSWPMGLVDRQKMQADVNFCYQLHRRALQALEEEQDDAVKTALLALVQECDTLEAYWREAVELHEANLDLTSEELATNERLRLHLHNSSTRKSDTRLIDPWRVEAVREQEEDARRHDPADLVRTYEPEAEVEHTPDPDDRAVPPEQQEEDQAARQQRNEEQAARHQREADEAARLLREADEQRQRDQEARLQAEEAERVRREAAELRRQEEALGQLRERGRRAREAAAHRRDEQERQRELERQERQRRTEQEELERIQREMARLQREYDTRRRLVSMADHRNNETPPPVAPPAPAGDEQAVPHPREARHRARADPSPRRARGESPPRSQRSYSPVSTGARPRRRADEDPATLRREEIRLQDELHYLRNRLRESTTPDDQRQAAPQDDEDLGLQHYDTFPFPWNQRPQVKESVSQILSSANAQFTKKKGEFNMTAEHYPGWRSLFIMVVHRKQIPIQNKLTILINAVNRDATFDILMTSVETISAPAGYRLLLEYLENTFGCAHRQIKPRQQAVAQLRMVEVGDRAGLAAFNAAVHNLLSVYRDGGSEAGLGEFHACYDKLNDVIKMEYMAAHPAIYTKAAPLQDLRTLHEWTKTLFLKWTTANTIGPSKALAPAKTTGKASYRVLREPDLATDGVVTPEEVTEDVGDEDLAPYFAQVGLRYTRAQGAPELEKPTCCFCPPGQNSHLIVRCEVFRKCPVIEKVERICKDGRCTTCFRKGHISSKCPSKAKCRVCKEKHNTHLHEYFKDRKAVQRKAYHAQQLESQDSDDAADGFADDEEALKYMADQLETGSVNICRAGPTKQQEDHGLLPIVPVTLRNGKKSVRVNALLDTGATSTLISQELCKTLGLTGPTFTSKVALACNVVTELTKTQVSCNIVLPGRPERKIWASAVDNAVGNLEAVDWNRIKESYPHMEAIPFPRHEPGPVQMLLGATEHQLMMPLEIPISGKEGEPCAFITQLGWVAMGPMNDNIRRQHAVRAVFEVYARVQLRRVDLDEINKRPEAVNKIATIHELETKLRGGIGLDKQEYALLYEQRGKPCPLKEQAERDKTTKADVHELSPVMYERLQKTVAKGRSEAIHFSKAFEDELAKKILSEWEPDVSPQDEAPSLSAEQERCWKLLREGRTFRDGHYFMPVLWRTGEPTLEPDYIHALQRLDRLLQHLLRHGLTAEYDRQIREHIDNGYLVRVEPHSGKFYLPHFAVIREDKSTTQLRQVFDGAAARKGGRSLNSAMSAGPKLITDLNQVLMYYRAHRIALAGDIRHMFLQVFMYPEDRKYHHILHKKEEGAPLEELEWTRHPFGSAGSPAVAIATLKLHAADHKEEFPLAAQDVLQHSLVDDILSSFPTEEEAIRARTEWSELCSKAGMLVRKYITNSPEVFAAIPEELREKRATLLDVQELEGESMLKTLGMHYSAKTDEFSYSIDLSDSPSADGWTKRKILVCYSRFFDPLGLLAPFTIIPRHAFQALWRQELSWDEKLDKIVEWEDWLQSAIADIGKIRIPRCVTRLLQQGACEIVEQTLHVFADASGYALGVAIYLVTVYTDGLVVSNNVRSRAKLAQLKPTTIPRLELAAALLAVETAQMVSITYGVDNIRFYTDSTTTLLWLRTKHRQLKQYVANRVMKILGRTKLEEWFYVNTTENPADIPSRGALLAELVDNDLWWHGPAFLLEQRQPDQPTLIVKEDQRDEFVKETRDLFEETPIEVACRHSILPCDTHASITELEPLRCDDQKVIYLKDLIDSHRSDVSGDNLSEKQVCNQLLLRLILGAQLGVWPELFKGCKPSHPVAKLAPRVDHLGVLRVTTRLALSKDIDLNPTPILLPPKEVITWLIVKDFHENELKHVGGPAYLLSRIRKDYWIHKGTRLVQNVLKKCLECQYKRARPTRAPEAPLPSFRLPDRTPLNAFTEVGTDCAGPWEVNVGRRTEKRWIVLFICMITRAIYTEVIDSLSTETFLNALEMLAARRGMPSKIYSDNGTNFKGASAILNELLSNNRSSLDDHAHQIEWHFNTPHSPHQGGLWERTIGTLKAAMKKLLTCDQYLAHKLQAEEFRTLVTIAEGYVNNRPLTAVSMENGDLAPITPADLCMSNATVGFSLQPPTTQGGTTKSAKSTTHARRWRLVQEYADITWRRLRSEVVPKHAEYKRSWLRNKTSLRKGDVVIVIEPNTKGVYRLGRVLEIFPGSDGVARNASIKVLKTPDEIAEEVANKRSKMTAEIMVGHRIYQRSLASLAVLASAEDIERVRRADLPPVPDMDDDQDSARAQSGPATVRRGSVPL